MKHSEISAGMEVAIGPNNRKALVLDPNYNPHSASRVAAATNTGLLTGNWQPVLLRPSEIRGLYAEVQQKKEEKENERREIANKRIESDHAWDQRRQEVVHRLRALMTLSFEDTKERFSIGRFIEEKPARQISMAIEDMEKIVALLENTSHVE